MKLSDIQKRLQAPFPVKDVHWKPASFNRERSRALLLAHIDARAVQDRLDATCPDDWSFELELVTVAMRPTVKGRLTVLGVVREDFGEGDEVSTLKAAASDAFKRCAGQFGIGRYLDDLPESWVDWDDARHALVDPVQMPELPQWARPDHERSPGGAHLMQALEQLKYELPDDMGLQREIYKHLKAALGSLHPVADHA